jgi:hypothetical protein
MVARRLPLSGAHPFLPACAIANLAVPLVDANCLEKVWQAMHKTASIRASATSRLVCEAHAPHDRRQRACADADDPPAWLPE